MPRGSRPGEHRGGRKTGTPNKITTEVRDLARQHGAKVIDELARLATAAQSEQARVAAIKELLDRAYGKSPQAFTGDSGEGPVMLQIVTGVSRREDGQER
jgi:hypothetical protein